MEPRVSGGSRSRVGSGLSVLEELGPGLDDLLASVGAPVTARRTWLERWARSHPRFVPVAVVVEGGARLEAAALLAVRARPGLTDVVGMGHGTSDYTRLPARDAAAAASLGEAVAGWLRRLRGPWRLRVEQLPPGDPAARAIAGELRCSALVPGDGAPRMMFETDRSLSKVLGKSARQSERTDWNRIRREGLPVSMARLRAPGDIERRLPEMEEVRRLRDAQLGRRTDLLDPATRAFWRGIVLDLAARGEAEVTLLEVEGRLAAYATCFIDGRAVRMWDARFDPRWARIGAGRITDLVAFHRAREDEGVAEFDWMRGEEGYKARHGNDLVRTEHLLAWSSAPARAVFETPRRVRSALRRAKEHSPALRRGWDAVKRRTIARPRPPG